VVQGFCNSLFLTCVHFSLVTLKIIDFEENWAPLDYIGTLGYIGPYDFNYMNKKLNIFFCPKTENSDIIYSLL